MSKINQQPQTEQGTRVAGTLLLAVLFLLILLLMMPARCCCALAPEQWSQERIYAAEVNTVNPNLEGKMVKLKITEIHSDALAIVVEQDHRYFFPDCDKSSAVG